MQMCADPQEYRPLSEMPTSREAASIREVQSSVWIAGHLRFLPDGSTKRLHCPRFPILGRRRLLSADRLQTRHCPGRGGPERPWLFTVLIVGRLSVCETPLTEHEVRNDLGIDHVDNAIVIQVVGWRRHAKRFIDYLLDIVCRYHGILVDIAGGKL